MFRILMSVQHENRQSSAVLLQIMTDVSFFSCSALLENCGSLGMTVLSIFLLLTTYNCHLPTPLFHFTGSLTDTLLVPPVGALKQQISEHSGFRNSSCWYHPLALYYRHFCSLCNCILHILHNRKCTNTITNFSMSFKKQVNLTVSFL